MRSAQFRIAVLVAALAAVFPAGIALAYDGFSSEGEGPLYPDASNGRVTEAPSIQALRLNGHDVRVDGRLDDPAWRTAKRLVNFAEVEPGDNIHPSVETEAFMAYDDDFLYAAFEFDDPDPRAIRAPN